MFTTALQIIPWSSICNIFDTNVCSNASLVFGEAVFVYVFSVELAVAMAGEAMVATAGEEAAVMATAGEEAAVEVVEDMAKDMAMMKADDM